MKSPAAARAETSPPPQSPENEEVCPDVQSKMDRALEFIIPEANERPEIRDRAVEMIKDANMYNCSTSWSETKFYNTYRKWSKTNNNDFIKLEEFIACDAAHKSLSMRSDCDGFANIIKKRKMYEWATARLQPAALKVDQQANSKKPLIKLEKLDKHRAHKPSAVARASLASTEKILPSIERASPQAPAPAPTRPLTFETQEISPFHSPPSAKRGLTVTLKSHEAGPAPKAPKVTRDAPQPLPSTCDAAIQTESKGTNNKTLDLFNDLVDPFKSAFSDVVAQQTKTLTEILPAAVKTAVQESLASEAVHQQPHATLLRSQVPRPAAPEAAYLDPVALQSQIYGTVNYPHGDARSVVGRGGARGLAPYMAAEDERLFNLGAYSLARWLDPRRH